MGLEILFWIWVLTWMVKTAATDVIYSTKGETPPRYRARLARVERGEQAQRYGVGGWFTDLKEDALQAHTEKRRTKAQDKARKQAETPPPNPIDDMVDVAGVRDHRRPPGSKPSPRPRPNAPIPDAPTLKTVPNNGGHSAHNPTQQAGGTRPKAEGKPPAVNNGKPTNVPPTGTPSTKATPPLRLAPITLPPRRGGANGGGPTNDVTSKLVSPPPIPPEVLATAHAALAAEDPDGHRRLAVMDAAWNKVAKAHPDTAPEVIDRALDAVDEPVGTVTIAPVNELAGDKPVNGHPITNSDGISPSPMEGTDMFNASGETTRVDATRAFLLELETHIQTNVLPAIERCAASAGAEDVDPAVVAAISGLRDRFSSAAAGAGDARSKHDDWARLMEEAVNNTSNPAKTDYYRHS